MSKQILYVDDNLPNRLLVKRIVEAEGYTLLEAEDAVNGWETAVANTPDLILMDLHLPGDSSGYDLTRRIKMTPNLSHIPIVAITAHGHSEAEAQAMSAGCIGFLHKPADIRQIRQTLRQYLNLSTAGIVESTAPSYAYI
ncbi:MAG: response regulator [Chloroflexota bacterium]